MVIADETAVRNAFLERSEKLSQEKIKSIQNELKNKNKRLADLDGLLENAYVDKVKGKIPEDICVMLITRYTEEKKTLTADIEMLNESLAKSSQVSCSHGFPAVDDCAGGCIGCGDDGISEPGLPFGGIPGNAGNVCFYLI